MRQVYYHGTKKRYPYFEGWYLKHQNEGRTIAFIPALHADKNGNWSASLQIVMDEGAWNFTYPIEMCRLQRKKLQVKIGDNLFSEKGISVNIHTEGLSVQGKIQYAGFHRIKGDIMGPFCLFPFMQCSHGVISMSHGLKGSLLVNGENMEFTGGRGYIETDWGTSFPETYLWTQCGGFGRDKRNSIMASAADIPFMGTHFKGVIAAIHYEGREYRLATYFGGRIYKYGDGELKIIQGSKKLEITRLSERAFPLKAPLEGSMARIIKESPSCPVKYRFSVGDRQIFDMTAGHASFEQV